MFEQKYVDQSKKVHFYIKKEEEEEKNLSNLYICLFTFINDCVYLPTLLYLLKVHQT